VSSTTVAKDNFLTDVVQYLDRNLQHLVREAAAEIDKLYGAD
jgi:hypothetical protein